MKFIKSQLQRFHNRLNKELDIGLRQTILENYSRNKENLQFIQIGSNDGLTGDPISEYIKKYKWRGILVEPIPYLFAKLKQNYSLHSDHLMFENAAISIENGAATFYRLKECNDASLPEWYDQLGSFNKEVVLKHKDLIPQFNDLIIEDTVVTLSFYSLLQKHDIHQVDLVHIDTEGYDFEILKLIDFKSLNIEIVLFEHQHLNADDYQKALKLLKDNNFKTYKFQGDTMAISKTTIRNNKQLFLNS